MLITLLRLRPLRATISKERGWSQHITPVVCSPVPTNETAKSVILAKFPPLVMGKTMSVFVKRLNASGDTISTGCIHFSHRQRLGQGIQTKFTPLHYKSSLPTSLASNHSTSLSAKSSEVLHWANNSSRV